MLTDIKESAKGRHKKRSAALAADHARVIERQHPSFPMPSQPMDVADASQNMISRYQGNPLVAQGGMASV
jgi:hypothetical protein